MSGLTTDYYFLCSRGFPGYFEGVPGVFPRCSGVFWCMLFWGFPHLTDTHTDTSYRHPAYSYGIEFCFKYFVLCLKRGLLKRIMKSIYI